MKNETASQADQSRREIDEAIMRMEDTLPTILVPHPYYDVPESQPLAAILQQRKEAANAYRYARTDDERSKLIELIKFCNAHICQVLNIF